MEINFQKRKESVLNTLFLKLEYMSGDADAFEYEEISIKGINYTNYKDNLDIIKTEIDKYKLIGQLTDCNDELNEEFNEYDLIGKEFGKEIADIWDNVPSDVTYYDRKAHLYEITLCAYNEKGEYLESYI